MKRGRPVFSRVRQNMIEILSVIGKGYGYDIYRIYKEIFPKVTLRLLYYHLRKGLELEEFEIAGVKSEKGDFSWGKEVEKVYYKLGPKAAPYKDPVIRKMIRKIRPSRKSS